MKRTIGSIGIILLINFMISCVQVTETKQGAISGNIDPLPSWNEGPTKSAIIAYVKEVTNTESKNFIAIPDRIAVFDNDGTMWSERPLYFQFYFAMDRVKALAPEHPEWKNEQPFKGILENDPNALMASGSEGIGKVLAVTHSGTTVAEFHQLVSNWIQTAKHPTKDKPFTDFVYKPMLELLAYLQANDFVTYIVSGGSIEFMRPIICDIYNIPENQILGTSFKTVYNYNDGNPFLERYPEMDFYNDKGNKAVNIQKIIGKKPVFCGGNSDGDLAMMQWTAANTLESFMLYVHHTDSIREWAYDRKSHIGRLDKGLDEATEKGWTVMDMEKDWKVVFPFESKNK
ncbi:MAG: haloacid dehalogenase-like hydrolase [Bacteroidales bacterium]|nr:haloacid dehalogenase-like hydrolase [Bacteroidales bacterium]